MRSTVSAARGALRPSSSQRTTGVLGCGTAWRIRNSSWRRAIGLAPGMWLLLYSPASRISISAKGARPSRRFLSAWHVILLAISDSSLKRMRAILLRPRRGGQTASPPAYNAASFEDPCQDRTEGAAHADPHRPCDDLCP